MKSELKRMEEQEYFKNTYVRKLRLSGVKYHIPIFILAYEIKKKTLNHSHIFYGFKNHGIWFLSHM